MVSALKPRGVLIDVMTTEIRARGRFDMASVASADRPLVIVGSKKELVVAVTEAVVAWRASSRSKSARVLLRGASGAALRVWRAELKRHALDSSQTKDDVSGSVVARFVGIDLSSSPAQRTDVTIYQSSGKGPVRE